MKEFFCYPIIKDHRTRFPSPVCVMLSFYPMQNPGSFGLRSVSFGYEISENSKPLRPAYQIGHRDFLAISLFFARFLQGNVSIGNIPHYRTSGCGFRERGTEVSISFSTIFLSRFQANAGNHRLVLKTHMKIFFKKGTEFSTTFQRNDLPNHSHPTRPAGRSP